MELTPIKAIRLKCLDCAESPKEVRLCPSEDCFLFQYRLGKNPRRTGIGGNPHWKKGVSIPKVYT